MSKLFTAPLVAGADFHWRDITPVQRMALDQLVLWINAALPYKIPQELPAALRGGAPGSPTLGAPAASKRTR